MPFYHKMQHRLYYVNCIHVHLWCKLYVHVHCMPVVWSLSLTYWLIQIPAVYMLLQPLHAQSHRYTDFSIPGSWCRFQENCLLHVLYHQYNLVDLHWIVTRLHTCIHCRSIDITYSIPFHITLEMSITSRVSMAFNNIFMHGCGDSEQSSLLSLLTLYCM